MKPSLGPSDLLHDTLRTQKCHENADATSVLYMNRAVSEIMQMMLLVEYSLGRAYNSTTGEHNNAYPGLHPEGYLSSPPK